MTKTRACSPADRAVFAEASTTGVLLGVVRFFEVFFAVTTLEASSLVTVPPLNTTVGPLAPISTDAKEPRYERRLFP